LMVDKCGTMTVFRPRSLARASQSRSSLLE
jgi:hypothetical protein